MWYWCWVINRQNINGDITLTEERQEVIHRPPPPKYQQGVTLDSANALNTKEMLSKDKDVIVYIGNLSSREANAVKLMLAIGQSPLYKMDFLERYAHHVLQVSCSKEGFRSKQIVEMNKASPIIEGGGFSTKMKEALHL